MAAKKRGLGRGLSALLEGSQVTVNGGDAQSQPDFREMPIDLIQRGKYQPRVDMHPESLKELADSIKAQGVVQPIVVRPLNDADGRYEIIAGERRWRATQMAGLQMIPVVVRDVSDQATIAMAIIENIQREDLNPIEEARALQRLIQEFELTHQQAAEAVGRSRVSVSNLLRLLELNPDVLTMVEHGDLEMGHARALLALELASQCSAAHQVVAQGMSVRETERLVKALLQEDVKKDNTSKAGVDPDVRRLEQALSEQLAAVVKVQHTSKGKGKLVIHYNSVDELDGILVHIQKPHSGI